MTRSERDVNSNEEHSRVGEDAKMGIIWEIPSHDGWNTVRCCEIAGCGSDELIFSSSQQFVVDQSCIRIASDLLLEFELRKKRRSVSGSEGSRGSSASDPSQDPPPG